MKISYNWLKEYIKINSSQELPNYNETSTILTDIGLEVEGVEEFESIKGGLKGLVIGEVLSCGKHPNADKLSVTKVDIGKENPLDIVCGAPNVATGQKVVVATVGTTLYDGNDSFVIKKSKIRGEASVGMICAEDELGLGKSHDGIMELPLDTQVGMLAKDYFKIETDIVFEIGLTPNRIDGASHIGVARDLIAYLKSQPNAENAAKLNRPCVENFKKDDDNLEIEVKIENNSACHRYSGVCISNIKVEESPDWLKNRLKAIGLSPINNIVDITNYVLHETGQPLHAFDYEKVIGKKVIVKNLPENSIFKTLDEVERKLSDKDLMICNEKEGMCIAGVFGGLDSGVSSETKNIFLESAYFNSVSVRKTAKRHALNTDSSFRFERGTDPNNTVYALKRAALLIKEIAGANISSDIIDIYPEPVQDFEVKVKFAHIDRLIGKQIPQNHIKQILKSLEIKIKEETSEELTLLIPPYRVDVQREVDVIEEILRIYGYNNIEVKEQVRSTLSYAPKPNLDKIQNSISDLLSNKGFNETMANSLTKVSYYEKSESFPAEKCVKILNPLSADLNVMRQTLLFGGLEAVAYNRNRQNNTLKFYEFGNCYSYFSKEEEGNNLNKYFENKRLNLFITGNKQEVNWISPEKPTSFYQIKTFAETVLDSLNFDLDKLKVTEVENDIFSYALSLGIKKKVLVTFGSISKKLLKEFDIDSEVFYADFNWDMITNNLPKMPVFKELPKYPEVRRDLALLLDKEITFAQVKEIAQQTEKKLLKKVSIFDVYEGKNLGENKKSYAVSFIIQDEEKTLTDKQIDKIMQKLIKNYENKLSAVIR